MLVNDKQKKFMELRIVEGKSYETISKEIDVPVAALKEWSINLIDEIEMFRSEEIDKLQEEYGLRPFKQIKHLAQLYSRMRKELDSRDFSGLPTDKLYYIFYDVEKRFNSQFVMLDDEWEDDLDYDDFDYRDDE